MIKKNSHYYRVKFTTECFHNLYYSASLGSNETFILFVCGRRWEGSRASKILFRSFFLKERERKSIKILVLNMKIILFFSKNYKLVIFFSRRVWIFKIYVISRHSVRVHNTANWRFCISDGGVNKRTCLKKTKKK